MAGGYVVHVRSCWAGVRAEVLPTLFRTIDEAKAAVKKRYRDINMGYHTWEKSKNTWLDHYLEVLTGHDDGLKYVISIIKVEED